jgi:phosphatidate cytidylyltransferase
MSVQTRRTSRWADLGTRIASAAVLVPLALLAVRLGGAPFVALVAIGACGMVYEWLTMCRARFGVATILPAAAVPLAVWLTLFGLTLTALILLALAAIAAVMVARGSSPSRWLAFGILYIGLPSVALVWLRQLPAFGFSNVLVLLLIVWTSDIGAYAVGRLVGGPLLAPTISPGKTWSGALGGVVAVALVGLACGPILGDAVVFRPVILAICIGVCAQLGDLFESRLKRHFGVKDSGALIPGHGGLLDRLDAVLAAAPVAALLALALGRGVSLWG